MTTLDSRSCPEGKPYRLGVLLIHGIGEQPRGSTLREIIDPVVRSLDLWLHGVARCRATTIGQASARAWAQMMPTGIGTPQSEARFREKAHEMAWSAEWNPNPPTDAQKAQLGESTFWSGGASLSDGIATHDDEAPPHAHLHVHTLGENYDACEGTALLAECWWARAFAPTTAWSLAMWACRVVPFTIGMHFGDVVRRHLDGAAESNGHPWQRSWHALRALLALLCMLFAVAVITPLVLSLLISVSVLSLVPVSAVRNAVISIQSSMLGTLGDSFLLVDSPVSRAMIVGRCKRDLGWLRERCEQLIVVAHSQGCAVSYLALSEHLPDELREVTWIGSGLRKLEALRDTERDSTPIVAGWLAALMPWVLWSQGAAIAEQGASFWGILVMSLAVPAYIWGILRLVSVLRAGATAIRLGDWDAKGIRLNEVYASADPVPQGPMFDMTSQDHFPLPANEVHNLGSWLRDHTSYWRNVEQVMLPLGLRIALALGVPVERLLADDSQLLELAAQRRVHRVHALVMLRSLIWAGAITLLWLEAATLGYAWSNLMAWIDSPDQSPVIIAEPRLTQALLACLPVLAWVVVPYLTLALAWRGWEAHEQRCFLLRAPPNDLLELLLVFVMIAACAGPAGRAAALLWGDVGAGVAIALILVGAVFSAFFYVFSLKAPQRAFGFRTDNG